MKKIIYLTMLLTINFFSAPTLQAQDINLEEMNRDINILESVLEELFKMENTGDLPGFISLVGNYGHNVQGTYLPGFGVLFRISNPVAVNVLYVSVDNKLPHSSKSSEQNFSKENVKDKIIYFLANYATTIEQLEENSRIMVLFNGTSYASKIGREAYMIHSGDASVVDEAQVPVVSVVARESDLTAYENGNISKNEFIERLSISTKKPTRFKIPISGLWLIF